MAHYIVYGICIYVVLLEYNTHIVTLCIISSSSMIRHPFQCKSLSSQHSEFRTATDLVPLKYKVVNHGSLYLLVIATCFYTSPSAVHVEQPLHWMECAISKHVKFLKKSGTGELVLPSVFHQHAGAECNKSIIYSCCANTADRPELTNLPLAEI
jgi:hypothetical protein